MAGVEDLIKAITNLPLAAVVIVVGVFPGLSERTASRGVSVVSAFPGLSERQRVEGRLKETDAGDAPQSPECLRSGGWKRSWVS